MFKNLALGIVLMLFAAETVLAASISTRVRVLENKVTQFEKLIKSSGAVGGATQEQIAQIDSNAQDISILKIRLDKLQAQNSNPKARHVANKSVGSTGVSYLEDTRFTDDRYSYP